jgi:hypothetical protein
MASLRCFFLLSYPLNPKHTARQVGSAKKDTQCSQSIIWQYVCLHTQAADIQQVKEGY